MTDQDLMALCVLQEAGSEPDDGKAAVARVIKNRMAKRYQSDGTVTGTVLKKDQFSWAWFAFSGEPPEYHRIADTQEEAAAVADKKLAAEPQAAMDHAKAIVASVMAGTYESFMFDPLGDDALMYLNPRIVKKMPSWASVDKFICSIGHHDFYRA